MSTVGYLLCQYLYATSQGMMASYTMKMRDEKGKHKHRLSETLRCLRCISREDDMTLVNVGRAYVWG